MKFIKTEKEEPPYSWRGYVHTIRPDQTTAGKLATYWGYEKEGLLGWEIDNRIFNEVVYEWLDESEQPSTDGCPTWYTKNQMFDYLKQNNYSKEIATELSGTWADILQGAYKKGWEMGRNKDRKPEDAYQYLQLASTDGGVDRNENSDQGKAAIGFYKWMDLSSMSHPEIPLHIKYRMYADQQNAKLSLPNKEDKT
jgi:hypothetical protein